jgi:hypothetical protein
LNKTAECVRGKIIFTRQDESAEIAVSHFTQESVTLDFTYSNYKRIYVTGVWHFSIKYYENCTNYHRFN